MAQGSFIVDDRGAVAMKATSSSRDAPEVHWGSVNTEAEKPSSKGRPVRLSGGSDNGFGSALEAGPTEASSSSRAAYDDHGRHHFAAEKLAVIEQDDPFKLIFVVLDVVQEYALPLIVGIFVALVMANVAPKTYQYYFSGCGTLGSGSADDGYGIDEYGDHRSLSAAAGEDCSKKRWVLFDCPVFGHHWTLHFLANDVVMSFHFALAMKEVTEALLPGGSLNPPSKAMNPIMVTIGCVAGPIIAYFGILKLFVEMGMFDDELDRGLDWSDLSRGWGTVAATDIILAWIFGRLVFGDGHPAIDFLLLLAVASDGLGIVFIALFYTDTDAPVRPAYLSMVFGGMGVAFALRKWHFRKKFVTHQPWQPYVFGAGLVVWLGLIKARLHPALCLVFIVPFMPGPDIAQLDHLEEEIEEEIEDDVTDGHIKEHLRKRKRSIDQGSLGPEHRVNADDILAYHHAHRGRGISIQAGLFSGLAGHRVDDAFKVKEYDEDGVEHLNVSTLDSFEHFWKFYADLGLGFFALTNAGVELKSIGSMTTLILASLVVGKYSGIMLMFRFAKWLGFLPPLGVRTMHMRMIGLLASMGLTVALFVSDVAFADELLQVDAKIGALMSGAVGVVAWGISNVFDMSHELVDEQAKLQIMEELREALHKQDMSEKTHHALTFAGLDQAHLEGVASSRRSSGRSTPASAQSRTPRTSTGEATSTDALNAAMQGALDETAAAAASIEDGNAGIVKAQQYQM